MEVAISNLQVTLVDDLLGDYDEKRLKRLEDKWMVNLGTLFTWANSRNEVLSNRRRYFGGKYFVVFFSLKNYVRYDVKSFSF